MPTESEFLAAAGIFDAEASTASGLVAPAEGASGPEVLTGGQLTADLHTLLGAEAIGCTSDSTSLTDLAEECRRRAEATAEARRAQQAYDAAMGRHRTNMSDWRADRNAAEAAGEPLPTTPQPRAPSRPPTPPPWADISAP